METSIAITNSLQSLSQFFGDENIDFWLEAGSALAAYRDGKVFEWEHDIDIAIWKDDLRDVSRLRSFFQSRGYIVIIQKNLPFLDNLIQLRVPERLKGSLFDVDIYLYSRTDDYAYMRWIQKPEGLGSKIKKQLLLLFRNIVNPQSDKWVRRSKVLSPTLREKLFTSYLKWYIETSSCIFHRFPATFFANLADISFYGLDLKIPGDTESFLYHRYGPGWNTPDDQFNQSGKWKKSRARPLLPMNLLPHPVYDRSLIEM